MTFSWGVVHTVSPLTVIEDGSSNALPVIQSLVDPSSLTVGDMVRVELAQGGRVVVYGRPGGAGVPFAMAAGVASVAASSLSAGGGNTYSNVTVTFPSGRFTGIAPILTLGASAGSGSIGTAGFSSPPTSAVAFSARVIRFGSNVGSDAVLHWHAIQMSSGSASG